MAIEGPETYDLLGRDTSVEGPLDHMEDDTDPPTDLIYWKRLDGDFSEASTRLEPPRAMVSYRETETGVFEVTDDAGEVRIVRVSAAYAGRMRALLGRQIKPEPIRVQL